MDNLVIQDQHYCRSNSKERQQLANLLESFYDRKAVIVPSGMSAISCSLTTILNKNMIGKNGISIIMGNELYCDTPTLIKHLQQLYNTYLDIIDINNNDNIFAAVNKNLNKDCIILFVDFRFLYN